MACGALVTTCFMLCLVLTWLTVDGSVKCDRSIACYPWASPSCTRGNNINLRFFSRTNRKVSNVSSEGPNATTAAPSPTSDNATTPAPTTRAPSNATSAPSATTPLNTSNAFLSLQQRSLREMGKAKTRSRSKKMTITMSMTMTLSKSYAFITASHTITETLTATMSDTPSALSITSSASSILPPGYGLRWFEDLWDGYSVTWAFCPRVDELQAFNLSKAPMYAAVDPVDNTSFVVDMQDTFVSVYGFGESDGPSYPANTSASRAMIATNGSFICSSNSAESVAIVEFLVFQISLVNGLLTYPGATASWGNESGTYVQPQGTGFIPTCDNGLCSLDATMKCIGEPGMQNCASCYTDPLLVANRTVQIWTSYYGTDNQGRRFLSGSNNPLNFRQYAGASVYSTLSTSVDRITTGQPLDPALQL